MKRGNLILLLAIATFSVLLAWYVGRRPQETIPENGQPLLPEFLQTFSHTHRITLRSHEGTVNLLTQEDGRSWQVQERFGYPADLEKLRALRDGWAGLTVIEPKTTKPELFPELDLADLSDPASKAMQMQLHDTGQTPLLDWLVGKHHFVPGGGEAQEYYVRPSGKHFTYLVRGTIPLETKPEQWLAPRVTEFAADRIQEARLLDADLTIRPRDAVSVDVDGLAPGEEVVSQYTLSNLVETLRSMQLNDVLPVSQVETLQNPAPVLRRFQLLTRDGLQVDYRLIEHGGKKYILLKASMASSANLPSTGGSLVTDKNKQAGGVQGEKGRVSVTERIKTLNAQWAPWAFELKSYDATKLLRERKDMVRKAQQQLRR